MNRDEIIFDGVKREGPLVTTKFLALLERGESVNMAAMLATQKPPAVGMSDHLIMKNRLSLLDQFQGNQAMLDLYQKQYRAETGEDIPSDAVIYRGLARYPGDPECIVTHKRSLKEVQEAMRKRNVEVQGDWTIERQPEEPKPQEVRLRGDLIEQYRAEMIAEEPTVAERDQREVTEQIVEEKAPVVTASDLSPMGVASKQALLEKAFGR